MTRSKDAKYEVGRYTVHFRFPNSYTVIDQQSADKAIWHTNFRDAAWKKVRELNKAEAAVKEQA